MNSERFTLDATRIREIPGELFDAARAHEDLVAPQYADWFFRMSRELENFLDEWDFVASNEYKEASIETLRDHNYELYADILPENYGKSYGNPVYAVSVMGEDFGKLLSAVTFELRASIPYVYEQDEEELCQRLELFLELYSAFRMDKEPEYRVIKKVVYEYVFDYCEDHFIKNRRQTLVASKDYAQTIMAERDPADLRYLYCFGEYVTENELGAAAFVASLPEETLQKMADTTSEGFRIGFINTGKDLDSKHTVAIEYHLGFEQLAERVIQNFEKLGKECTVPRETRTLFSLGSYRGYVSSRANQQYDYDHKEDLALVLDDQLMTRILEALEAGYKESADEIRLYAGPAVLEAFGEPPFSPVSSKEQAKNDPVQQKEMARYRTESSRLYNDAVIGRNRSFTIIDFPLPSIADEYDENGAVIEKSEADRASRYADIFQAVIEINTLDYKKYEAIQKTIIDALDEADTEHIVGRGENQTDLTVNLWKLTDPDKQTIFENCVADVNIPVGEVFTSPVLEGTNGLLHVLSVYLEGYRFDDLAITFENGRIKDYRCGNFYEGGRVPAHVIKALAGKSAEEIKASTDVTDEERDAYEKGRTYIEENILFHHPTLPMGEAAIGTNTTAYAAGLKYDISGRLPILIAEKTGPHFAVGDTCYSHDEDNVVYNPDGKEIVAKENDYSLLRDKEPGKAYFGCHTDITIPYAELGAIEAVHKDGSRVTIIRDGRFVLEGTEELNSPLDTI